MATRAGRPLTITLPRRMARMVEKKVSSGEYASADDVVRDGLRALQRQHDAITAWLKDEGAPAYDAYFADPTEVTELEETFDRLIARSGKRKAAGGR